MLEHLDTERSLTAARELDRLPTASMLAVLQGAEARVGPAVAEALERIGVVVDVVASTVGGGRRVYYIGAGTSGRLGVLDAAECPPTFGVPPNLFTGIIAGGEKAMTRAVEGVEDDAGAGARDLAAAGFGKGDCVVGIAASGRTPYVLGAMRKAAELGGVTCGISCTAGAELSALVQYPIEVVPGPEAVTGSTRLSAGTATKVVLNMISTGAMVRLGYVYGNLMVNVQPSNVKLVARARRIVAEAAGIDDGAAAELLERAGNDVRTAIVMQRRNVPREDAERLLAEAGGRIRVALGE